MKPIKTIVVEDEWIVSEEISQLLINNGIEVVGQAEDADEAMKIIKANQPDLALLDINIKGEKDGIELAKEIVRDFNCGMIFLTAVDDEKFVNRAKAVNPATYMVKPFAPKNLLLAIEIAFNNLSQSQDKALPLGYKVSDFVFLRDQDRYKKVAKKEIRFVQAEGSYTHVHTDEGVITLAINLKRFESEMADAQFLRIHRSYLVNLNRVDEFDGNVLIVENKSIPISTSYRPQLLRHFKFI